jgi:hypothetical protein
MIHTGKHRALIAEAGARLYVTFTYRDPFCARI